jgi:hypothetical protein
MMGRMSLREVREALAAAKARGAKASAKSPTVEELESLAKLLEREADRGVPAKEPTVEGAAEPDSGADGGGRRGSRRSTRPGSPRRR